jgi:hypothetical protein
MDAISKKKHQQDDRTPYQGEKHTYDPKSIFKRQNQHNTKVVRDIVLFLMLSLSDRVPISNQRNIKEHVPVECETSGATSQDRMYCCSHGMHSNG